LFGSLVSTSEVSKVMSTDVGWVILPRLNIQKVGWDWWIDDRVLKSCWDNETEYEECKEQSDGVTLYDQLT
jgi:hypothetical protein